MWLFYSELRTSTGRCWEVSYSNCKPSTFGDVVHLMKYFHIDKDLTVTGKLPAQGNNGKKTMKSYAVDAKWIIKTLREQIDKNDDFEDNDKAKTES